MKTLGTMGLLFVMVVATSTVFGQERAKKGDYKFLKGESELNLVFEYDGMTVGRDLTEDDYVNEKVSDYNEDEAGKGDKWKDGWIKARKDRYEPKFETLINKSMERVGIVASQGADSKYTLRVTTTYTEPGWHVGVMKKAAFCNFIFTFTDTDGKEVGKYSLENVPGSQAMGFDFDAGSRLAECYAKAGKMLGGYISKSAK